VPRSTARAAGAERQKMKPRRSFADISGPGLQCSRSLTWLRPASEWKDN
jgi:hypothetical protein